MCMDKESSTVVSCMEKLPVKISGRSFHPSYRTKDQQEFSGLPAWDLLQPGLRAGRARIWTHCVQWRWSLTERMSGPAHHHCTVPAGWSIRQAGTRQRGPSRRRARVQDAEAIWLAFPYRNQQRELFWIYQGEICIEGFFPKEKKLFKRISFDGGVYHS